MSACDPMLTAISRTITNFRIFGHSMIVYCMKETAAVLNLVAIFW